MKKLGIIFLIHGFVLLGYVLISSIGDVRVFETFKFYESVLSEPFDTLKKENPEAYIRIAHNESAPARTISFAKRIYSQKTEGWSILSMSGVILIVQGIWCIKHDKKKDA